MLRHPAVADGGLLGWGLVSLVVEPAEPLGGDHGGVIVYTVLGVVDDPTVAAVEIFIVLIIFVSMFVFSH